MSINIAKRVLEAEAEAIKSLINEINDEFEKIVNLLYDCTGRVIVVGLGKSGIIGSKFAASLSSTGTPSFFLHASEAVHGGLGILSQGDVLVAVSFSGESSELQKIIVHAKRLNLKILAITGKKDSSLAIASDLVLHVKVEAEASNTIPLLPTTSTTVMLALCDAVTVTLFEKKGFFESDFAKIHPGGAIGRRLTAIKDLMHTGDKIPLIEKSAGMHEIMNQITEKNFGLTGVTQNGNLIGVITDADIRRFLIKNPVFDSVKAEDIMTLNPKTIYQGEIAAKAIALFEEYTITSLFVVDKKHNKKVVGYIHLKDLLRAKVL